MLIFAYSVICARGQEPAFPNTFYEKQQQGQRLFQQRCSICHTLPMVMSKPYGPLLNKEIVSGREGSVRSSIMEGEIGLMPGFKYGLQPAEINSIIEYLKTVKKPAQPIINWVAEP